MNAKEHTLKTGFLMLLIVCNNEVALPGETHEILQMECRSELGRLAGHLEGREVRVSLKLGRVSVPKRLAWSAIAGLVIPKSQTGVFAEELTVWRNTTDVTFHEDKTYHRIVTLGKDQLYLEKGFAIVHLSPRKNSYGMSGPFYGVFDGPSRHSSSRFREWSNSTDWKTKFGTTGEVELYKRSQNEEIRIYFTPEIHLSRVSVIGTALPTQILDGYSKIEYKDVIRFTYREMQFGGIEGAMVPAEFEAYRMGRFTRDGESRSELRRIEAEIQTIASEKVEPPSFKECDLGVPNGTRVEVEGHPGIEFEWRDGEVVRTIDRKKVDSLSGFRFTGAKWFLPTVVLLVSCVGAVWWWVKRRNA